MFFFGYQDTFWRVYIMMIHFKKTNELYNIDRTLRTFSADWSKHQVLSEFII